MSQSRNRNLPKSRQSLGTHITRESNYKSNEHSINDDDESEISSFENLSNPRVLDKTTNHEDLETSDDERDKPDNSDSNADYSDDSLSNEAPNPRHKSPYNVKQTRQSVPLQIKTNSSSPSLGICIGLILMTLIVIIVSQYSDSCKNNNNHQHVSLVYLKEKFPNQTEDLWFAIQAGVEDIKRFHKPRTILLLYHENAKKALENILKNISVFIVCEIKNDCQKQPIVLTNEILNSNNLIDDYGAIVHKYKNELEMSGVMVVKNLELLSGNSAPAFHVFCDEYSPFVADSFIIFTMKINQYHDTSNNVKFVGNYLRDVWSNVDEDKFYPLLTRITNVILEITPE